MPATIVSRATAEHYLWGGNDNNQSDGWYLVRTPDLNIIEERMPPTAFETRHFHKVARQFFYVLAGELTMEIEHHIFTLHPGEGIEIAPGQAHQASNHGRTDLSILVTSQPPSHSDRFEAP
jgi:mannose-6-phosphate isomerase-like protein (cupin superfamily)